MSFPNIKWVLEGPGLVRCHPAGWEIMRSLGLLEESQSWDWATQGWGSEVYQQAWKYCPLTMKRMAADEQSCHCSAAGIGKGGTQWSARLVVKPCACVTPSPSLAGLRPHCSRLPPAPWLRAPSPRGSYRRRLPPCPFCCCSGLGHPVVSPAPAAASARTWRPR